MANEEQGCSPDSTSDRQHVYVVDDDQDIRNSLHFLLESISLTSWPYASAVDFIERLPDLIPAPILLDIRMPDIDGIELLKLLAERENSWPVIVMTAHGNVSVAVRAIKLGAIEFLEKPFSADMLQDALNGAFRALERTKRMLQVRDDARRLFGKLTKREAEVVWHLMEGASNKEAAFRLGLSVRTVELHRASALCKLQVKKMAEVVTMARDAELTPGGLGDSQRDD